MGTPNIIPIAEGEVDDSIFLNFKLTQSKINYELVDSNRQLIKESWPNICKHICRSESDTYLQSDSIRKVADILRTTANKSNISFGNVLEIMAGSGIVSTQMQSELVGLFDRWICTDLLPPTDTVEKLDSIDSVEKYGADSDTLLLINPPPYVLTSTQSFDDLTQPKGYGDYFACKDFIKQKIQTDSVSYIIFVGEMGQAEGSDGMYHYLTDNPNLELITDEIYTRFYDCFHIASSKNVYVFRIKN